jgi:hypothetical protein
MIKHQINMLLKLAAIDRSFAGRERKLIEHFASVNGVDRSQELEVHAQKTGRYPDLEILTEEERFEYLYMLIQLMKVDGQVFKSEIVYCEDMAEKLGYKRKVVAELSKNIYSDPCITADRDMLLRKSA